MKTLPLFLISYFIYFSLYSQPDSQVLLFDKISNLDYNSSEPDSIKLKSFYLLKAEIQKVKPLNDSAYILVLIKISKYQSLVHRDYELSISFANKALNVTNSLKRKSLKPLIINCYY